MFLNESIHIIYDANAFAKVVHYYGKEKLFFQRINSLHDGLFCALGTYICYIGHKESLPILLIMICFNFLTSCPEKVL